MNAPLRIVEKASRPLDALERCSADQRAEEEMLARFTTRRLSLSNRHGAWDDAVARLLGPLITDHGPRFDGRIDLRRIAGLAASRMIHSARAVTRDWSQIGQGDPEMLHVVLQLSGRATVRQGGGEAEMLAGEIVFIDSGRPHALTFPHKVAQVWLHIPRQMIERRSPYVSGPPVSPVSGPAAVLLGGLIRSAYGNVPSWTQGQAEAIRDALVGVVAETWRAKAAAPGAAETVFPPILHVIQEYVLRNLHEPNLSPESIAREHGLSVRHLHRLFETFGMSIGRWIRRSRLDRCAADLVDHTRAAESVTRIAHSWGFEDSAHFSRAFKAEFGQSPRSFRLERRAHF
jgi:AraC-like DNA-binding protein